MKKILLLFLIIGLYFNRSYAYFYNFLGQQNLIAPIHETKIIIGNQLNIQTIKYVALGDSLTEGVGASDYRNSYPYLIAKKLSLESNVTLVNIAHAGDTSSDIMISQLSKTLSEKPDLITLLIGVNDIHNRVSLKVFESNLTQTLKTLKETHAKIYLLSVPYLGSDKIVYFPYNFILDFQTKQFNEVIKKLANQFNVEYVDLYLLKKPDRFYSSDEFHPSDQGYKGWLEAINVD